MLLPLFEGELGGTLPNALTGYPEETRQPQTHVQIFSIK